MLPPGPVAQASPLLRLPPEVIERILTDPRIPSESVARVAACCRSLRSLVYDRADLHLWRTLYLNEFDDPRLRPEWEWREKKRTIPWKHEYQRRSHAVRIALSPHNRISHGIKCRLASPLPVDTHDVYEALADIVAEALPVDLEPNSKNIKLLRRIAESSHFGFNEDLPNTVDEERPCVRVPIAVDDEARLHVLLGHGHHAAFREELYRHYQTIVFSLKTYAVTRREFSFWPFAADNASVQWPVVEALIVTLMSTVKQWTNDPDSPPDVWDLYNGMQVGPQNMQIGTQIGWDARPPHDWAGIEGTWTGSYWFLDHGDFLMFNADPSDVPDLGLACGGNLDMRLKICSKPPNVRSLLAIPPSVTTSAYPSERPTLYFEGPSLAGGFGVDIAGCVTYRADGHLRWDFVVSYADAERWRLTGFQIYEGTRIGIIGIWSPADGDVNGPLGPFWYWKQAPPADPIEA